MYIIDKDDKRRIFTALLLKTNLPVKTYLQENLNGGTLGHIKSVFSGKATRKGGFSFLVIGQRTQKNDVVYCWRGVSGGPNLRRNLSAMMCSMIQNMGNDFGSCIEERFSRGGLIRDAFI